MCPRGRQGRRWPQSRQPGVGEGAKMGVCTIEEVDKAHIPSLMISGDRPSGKTLVDARNGFNDLSCYAMLWTVRHLWPMGARFVFNCYKHRKK
eukprot:9197160-Ditylum_brightwellii.AAC.1